MMRPRSRSMRPANALTDADPARPRAMPAAIASNAARSDSAVRYPASPAGSGELEGVGFGGGPPRAAPFPALVEVPVPVVELLLPLEHPAIRARTGTRARAAIAARLGSTRRKLSPKRSRGRPIGRPRTFALS